MATSESKGRFFTKRIDSRNESNRIDSNRELECSSTQHYATKVCRYNWRSAGSLGWPFPVLIYKYIFRTRYTEDFFFKQHTETAIHRLLL